MSLLTANGNGAASGTVLPRPTLLCRSPSPAGHAVAHHLVCQQRVPHLGQVRRAVLRGLWCAGLRKVRCCACLAPGPAAPTSASVVRFPLLDTLCCCPTRLAVHHVASAFPPACVPSPQPPLRHRRPLHQLRLAGAAHLWRGLAQQPPRLPLLGAPRPGGLAGGILRAVTHLAHCWHTVSGGPAALCCNAPPCREACVRGSIDPFSQRLPWRSDLLGEGGRQPNKRASSAPSCPPRRSAPALRPGRSTSPGT